MRKEGNGAHDKASKENEIPSPIHYIDRYFRIPAAKIGPGEFYATQRNMLIVTVLGSCVSVCLRDAEATVGGMNHFMLPGEGTDSKGPVSEAARYGAHAMEILVNHLLSLGARRQRLEAKVFGAGRVIPGMTNIGERNAEFALDYLKRENIRVLAQNLGGDEASKVYFFPYTGRVLVKRLRTLRNNTIVVRERSYAEQLASLNIQPSADLFV
jgi:chemotaxis protein CheD